MKAGNLGLYYKYGVMGYVLTFVGGGDEPRVLLTGYLKGRCMNTRNMIRF